ncbi:unnamed protein product [Brassica oleracea var. botrytis]
MMDPILLLLIVTVSALAICISIFVWVCCCSDKTPISSFQQKNLEGFMLSTNWKEVGAKTIESTPPDGMELEKWRFI